MIAAAFLIAVLLMLLCAWGSSATILQKLGFVLLTAFCSTNLAVEYFGFERATLIIPTIHLVLGTWVAIISFRKTSFASNVLLLSYACMVGFDLLSFPLRIEGTYAYYAVLNILFGAQLITVGTPGAWLAIRRGALSGGQRGGPLGSRH